MDHNHGHSHHDFRTGKQHSEHIPRSNVGQKQTTSAVGHDNHDKHAGHHTSDFLNRFWVCVVLTIPILLLSKMIQHWLGFGIAFPGDQYVLLALGALTFIYGGWPFLTGMFAEVRHRSIGMMTLVAIAISVAFFYSVAVALGLEGMDFFWELATLIDIMLLGHWLEMRSQLAASSALESLVALLPAQVHVEEGGVVRDIALQDLRAGAIIVVKPGEKIPADSEVLEGESYVNESMLTGESIPVRKEQKDKVIAGSINGNGVLRARVTGVGKDSYLNKVIHLVRAAQESKSGTQNLADKVARWLTLVSILAGVGTFAYWYMTTGDLAASLERLVTVMVTACPHALGVAIPLVVAISTTKAATHGLLIRNRTAFEAARRLTTVVFDKTGTLTKGSHEVQHVIPLKQGIDTEELLRLSAAVQQHSEHYIGLGILRELHRRQLTLLPSSGFSYEQGIGVSATVDGRLIRVVGSNYFRDTGALPEIPEVVNQDLETVAFVLEGESLLGIITLADLLRETAKDAVDALHKLHIKSFLLTGDNEHIAASVSRKLRMNGYRAGVLPHQKQEKVKELQSRGEKVAMTGDGVNDAPALAQAEVGIAVGSGTDVAAETADIILVNSDPMDVVSVVSFARATYRKMIQNLFWAVGYNVVAIPLAAGVLYPHFVLSPALGSILMSASTVIVALNAQLLRLHKV